MDEEEDRLSSLPDCLIHEIISRLPETKYVIRTGTLSKRWQHLWPQVPNLTFNIDYRNLFDGTRVQSLINFYSSVDKIITQRGHLNLNKFKLHTRYFIEFESLVNKWIHSVVKCNIQELDLFLEIPVYEGGFVLDSESFSNNSCFSKLKLNDCQFNPRGTFRWKKLRSLSIAYAELNDHLIQNILSGSPVLETFKLKRCYGFSRMDITSKSLKNLVLSGYNPRNSDAHIIQVNAPNIWALTIQSFLHLWKLLLVDVSCLVKAHLDYTKYGHYETTQRETEEDMLKGLILSLRHVKELTIGDSCQTNLNRKSKAETVDHHQVCTEVAAESMVVKLVKQYLNGYLSFESSKLHFSIKLEVIDAVSP